MKGQRMAAYAAVAGVLGGAAAIGGALYAHSEQPAFGIPRFLGVYSDYLSGVYVLMGIGIVMVIGGLLGLRWPGVGAIIVCAVAMVGLIYTYDRGEYRWTPMLYYWGAPWVLAWLAGIFAGYAAYKSAPRASEALGDARPAHENNV